VITLAVTAAAGLGAVMRYVVDEAVVARVRTQFPLGTLLVNVTGSFVLGLIIGLTLHQGLRPSVSTVVGTGFAGGYTTLSTWAWATVLLARERETRVAWFNVVLSIGTGLLAAAAGLGLARL
jgi:CrcB protein